MISEAVDALPDPRQDRTMLCLNVIDKPSRMDVVTRTATLGACAEHGPAEKALAFCKEMEKESLVQPNSVTFACLMKACATLAAPQQGKQLHAKIRGMEGDTVMCTCLVHLYFKCGKFEEARRVWDTLRMHKKCGDMECYGKWA